MKHPERKKNPNLSAAWDEYGHAVSWDNLIDAKFGQHGFVALAWQEPDGSINYATLSEVVRGVWEMQNDEHEPVTRAVWEGARIKPDCDWLVCSREKSDDGPTTPAIEEAEAASAAFSTQQGETR